MKKFIVFFGVLLLFSSCTQQGAEEEETAVYDLVITNVNVIPMDSDTLIENTNVCITGEKISWIGTEEFEANQTVDGKGRFLMPALADMHVHLPQQQDMDNYLNMNLLAGVMYLRSLRGENWHMRMLDSLRGMESIVPRMYLSPEPFHGESYYGNLDSTIDDAIEQGYHLIKVLGIRDEASYNELIRVCEEKQIPVAGHVVTDLKKTLNTHFGCIEHLGGYDDYLPDSLTELCELTAERGVYNCATFDWYKIAYAQADKEKLVARAGMDYVSDKKKEEWAFAYQETIDILAGFPEENQIFFRDHIANKDIILMALEEAGAPMIMGPDASGLYQVPGFSMYDEMYHYKQAGMSNFRILQIATYNAAEYFGEADQWGSARNGQHANLILLDKNPIDAIKNIETVSGLICNGQWVNPKDLEKKIKKL